MQLLTFQTIHREHLSYTRSICLLTSNKQMIDNSIANKPKHHDLGSFRRCCYDYLVSVVYEYVSTVVHKTGQ